MGADIGINWRSVVGFTPRPLYPKEKRTGNHCRGDWVGLRSGLDAVKRKILPYLESNVGPSLYRVS
jgi:hypothetical protein